MPMLDQKTAEKVKEALGGLTQPVRLTLFTKEHDCNFCRQTHELLDEVAALSEQISVDPHDLEKERELAERFGVDRAPAIVVHGEQDRGIRFYGIPAGYEFSTLMESILDFGSQRPSPLSETTQKALQGIDKPVKMQVFFTPQ